MDKLVPAFQESLLEHPVNIAAEFLELGIDSVLENGLVKDIPILGTLVGVGKFAQNIHDRNLMRQTIAFLNEFNAGEIDERKLENYRYRINHNPKIAEAELGRVLILLNKNIDLVKSQYQARFFHAYVNEDISWDIFCELCDIVDRLFISDINLLREAYESDGVDTGMPLSYKHDRLISNGLLTNEARLSGSIIMGDLDTIDSEKIMEITEIGKIFCKYIFD